MTDIEWTHMPGYKGETWNPVTGCTKASLGCDNCYAERLTRRWGLDFSQVTLHPGRLGIPRHWRDLRMVFVCSMSDLFHPKVPLSFLQQVFAVMGETQHTYLVLTKRPGRMAYFAANNGRWPHNVWAGVSVENPKYLPRLKLLFRVPAPVRFLSAEPLLDYLPLRPWFYIFNWCILGGESGPHARPLNLAWVQRNIEDCRWAGVPVFVKQLGSAWAKENGAKHSKGGDPTEWPKELWVRQWPERSWEGKEVSHGYGV